MKESKRRLIDQEARGRRNNLILFGIQEKEGGEEDCVSRVADLLKEVGGLTNVTIQRCHRLGRKKEGQTRARPIIFNVMDFNDKVRILRIKKHMPRGVGVAEDFPWEIRKAREILIPELKREKDKGEMVYLAYPAKLIIDGRIVKEVDPVDMA